MAFPKLNFCFCPERQWWKCVLLDVPLQWLVVWSNRYLCTSIIRWPPFTWLPNSKRKFIMLHRKHSLCSLEFVLRTPSISFYSFRISFWVFQNVVLIFLIFIFEHYFLLYFSTFSHGFLIPSFILHSISSVGCKKTIFFTFSLLFSHAHPFNFLILFQIFMAIIPKNTTPNTSIS